MLADPRINIVELFGVYRQLNGSKVLSVFNKDECRKSAGTFLVIRQGIQSFFGNVSDTTKYWELSSLFE